ncbi:FAD binding domain-containing protein [Agrobacterium pusense]|uniref:FAD binding domain-containing protein n=1 Tax=Agrobacterium pusense TaxID=648995 RepID=UPI002897D0F6|nr:xanthine dehydrogenase family protein subunit M [Agrobacterium pusense]
MRSFAYSRPSTPQAALTEFGAAASGAAYLAGGTTLLDLMKLDVLQPERILDLNGLRADFGRIRQDGTLLRLGAFAKMAEVADHPEVAATFPVISQSLALAASPQIRNMASLGGNVLQRTRCAYFRDLSWSACNKRVSGSGCAAIEGANRMHAVLGTSSACIATYPGDFAQALMVLDASVTVAGPRGTRTLPFAELHRRPGDRPDLETTLAPGEIILEFVVPTTAWSRRSMYLKIRDRQSYEFAVASAAVALDLDGDTVREARIALGGLASVPWRASEAEELLQGQPLTEDVARSAAQAALAEATPQSHNEFKIELGQSTLVRALLQTAAMEVTE